MFTHNQIWAALDKIAELNSLSISGLSRRAGLDPTSFNKSKRVTCNGRLRWPST
jgi:phage repressor protein C with HTH and peptisase S24 domain